MSFESFGLHDQIVQGVRAMGFTQATPIQLRAIPLVLEGRDVIGSAQTGTGKTAAFGLPALSKMIPPRHESGRCRMLVLEPTRELAAQVETALRDYARFTTLTVALVHGGVGYGKQREALKTGIDALVATPGRLLDHAGEGSLNLAGVEILVLDEVDRMLDMGFLPDVRRIVQKCPKQRQTLFFTATLPPEIERLASFALTDAETIEIGARRSPAETVDHAFYPVASDQKFDLLLALLDFVNYDSALIFCRTKEGADRIGGRLKHANHSVAVLHSNRTQREREEALAGFKSGKFEVMVATDIASRGLDIAGVSHVVNYDVPQHPEDYVHRIGRTGRAQTTGSALTIVVAEDVPHVEAIERFIGTKVPRKKLDAFDYLYTALFDENASKSLGRGAIRGGRTHGGYSFAPRRRK